MDGGIWDKSVLGNVMFKKIPIAQITEYALSDKSETEPPPFVDTENLNQSVSYLGCPQVFDAVFEDRTILHCEEAPKRRFVGFEKVQLRWMKPDGYGGLIPR